MADSIPIDLHHRSGRDERSCTRRRSRPSTSSRSPSPSPSGRCRSRSPRSSPWTFREAFRVAREGRPGPVLIDLPLDVQKPEIECGPRPSTRRCPSTRPEPQPGRGRSARCDMLLAAERPLLLAGGGVILADARRGAASRWPSTCRSRSRPTLMGKGAIPEDHPLYAGIAGIQTSQRYANALVPGERPRARRSARASATGTPATSTSTAATASSSTSTSSPRQIGKVFGPDLGIVSDAKLALAGAARQRRATRRTERAAGRVGRAGAMSSSATLLRREDFDDVPVKPPRVFKEINEFFGDGHRLRHGDRPVPDLVGPVPEGLQAAPLPGAAARPARSAGRSRRHRREAGAQARRPPSRRRRRRLLVPVPDGGGRGRRPVQVPFVLVMLNNGYMGLIRQAETTLRHELRGRPPLRRRSASTT